MRHAAIFAIAITFISLGARSHSAEIAWESKLRDAHTKAQQQNKLLLLHFYTDNCVYCEKLESGAFRSDSVSQSINDNFIPVKVHGANNPKLAEMFKVNKYPTDVIVTTDGKALSHAVSPQQPDRYIAMLTGAQISYAKAQATLASATPATSPAPTASAASANLAASTMPVQVPSASLGHKPATASSDTAQPQSNQFMLPGAATANTMTAGTPKSGAVQAALASSRTSSGGMMLPTNELQADLTLPNPAALDSTAPNLPKTESVAKPELAIQGFCAVSVVNRGEWVEGKPELGVIHLGRLYLFADKTAMELFLTDPIPFTPMLNEIDVVRFFEEKKIVPGKREWGVIDPVHNRMFFFADEAAMLHFEKTFDRYLDASIEVMDKAIEESNPGV